MSAHCKGPCSRQDQYKTSPWRKKNLLSSFKNPKNEQESDLMAEAWYDHYEGAVNLHEDHFYFMCQLPLGIKLSYWALAYFTEVFFDAYELSCCKRDQSSWGYWVSTARHYLTGEDIILIRTRTENALPGLVHALGMMRVRNVCPVNWDALFPRLVTIQEMVELSEIEGAIARKEEQRLKRRQRYMIYGKRRAAEVATSDHEDEPIVAGP